MWPSWFKEGKCFGIAHSGALREVLDSRADGMEYLECGHIVVSAFGSDFGKTEWTDPVTEEVYKDPTGAPPGAHRRTCPECTIIPRSDPMYPAKGGSDGAEESKAICNGTVDGIVCPIRERCLEYAQDHKIRQGVWGGKSMRERFSLTADTRID